MAVGLRAAVNGEMLRRCCRAEEVRIVALDAADELRRKRSCQERILTQCFLPAAPARIAEDVDVRRPEIEPEIAPAVPLLLRLIVLGASFDRDRLTLCKDQRLVP